MNASPPVPHGRRRPGGVGVELTVAVALVVAGALVRAPQVGPSSLWLDDAWLALASKADGVGELVTVGVTAPGFAALLAAVVAVVGFSSSSAQALPFVLGVAAAPVLYLVARRLGLGRGAALVGAVLLLASPVHVAYSGRVKPFTADAVLSVIVLFAGWRVVERPDDGRRWGWVALVAVGSVVVSAAVATSVAGAYLAGLAATARHRPRRLAPALASLSGFGAFALVWYWAVIRPASTPGLRAYWADHYLDLGDGPVRAVGALAMSTGNVLDGFSGVPVALGGVAVVLAAVVAGVRRPLLAVLLLAPLAAGVVLAVLEVAPFGGGRTDIHLYPALALLVALGLHLVLRPLRPPTAGVASLAALVLVAAPLRPAPPYPAEDLRPLVEVVESSAGPDDAIAVYSASRWGHALYTSGPVDLRPDPTSANGFTALAADPRVRVLGPHRDVPARYEPEVEALSAGHDRIWLLSSHVRGDFAVLEQLLSDRGYEDVRTEDRPGASLTLWVRKGTSPS
ncbi:MAG: glycosyltransferase family 39 protein [Acidimicrobiia bacterium]|nr:glycosyltransferase family 39 protein [Acidimicrobiia bacterium]